MRGGDTLCVRSLVTTPSPFRHDSVRVCPYPDRMFTQIESTGERRSGLEDLVRRIQSEFTEMPGLRLTQAQAQRLWNLDALMCESLLSALIDVGFVARTRDGAFVRSTDTVLREAQAPNPAEA